MKLRIKEAADRTVYDEKLKMDFTVFNTLFEGEIGAIHFCCYDKLVANPLWMQQNSDGFMELHYATPNNISIEVDKDNDLWIRHKMTAEQLDKLAKSQEELKVEKEKALAKCKVGE